MKVDLAAAANQKATPSGSASAHWEGGKIEIDETKFLDLVARAVAAAMGNNLFAGRRPDGSGPMPARKYDGQPRGLGAVIARALAPIKTGALTWAIAAHREKAGHMARLMAGVPFLAPPIDSIRNAVHNAFLVAVKLSQLQSELPPVLPRAGFFRRLAGEGAARQAARDANRAARRTARDRIRDTRGEYQSLLRDLGLGGATPDRSALGKRIRSAARQRVRGAW